jgi:hypothetical protein
VAGGVVTFTAPTSGPSAILSSNSAIIQADGTAGVNAWSKGINLEFYTVSATASGIMTPATFGLVNYPNVALGGQPVFVGPW